MKMLREGSQENERGNGSDGYLRENPGGRYSPERRLRGLLFLQGDAGAALFCSFFLLQHLLLLLIRFGRSFLDFLLFFVRHDFLLISFGMQVNSDRTSLPLLYQIYHRSGSYNLIGVVIGSNHIVQ